MLRSDFIPWLFYAIAPDVVFQGNGISRGLLARLKSDAVKMELLDALYWTTFPSTPRSAGMLNDLEQCTGLPRYPLERIIIPTLVIHVSNDPIVPLESGEFSTQAISGAQFLKWEDGGHFCCVTHWEETIPTIHAFLRNS